MHPARVAETLGVRGSDMNQFTNLSTVRLSIESDSGRRKHVQVTIQRAPADSDRVVMEKASAEYRRLYGLASRIVAIYVTTWRAGQ
jgi:hypothetical protein